MTSKGRTSPLAMGCLIVFLGGAGCWTYVAYQMSKLPRPTAPTVSTPPPAAPPPQTAPPPPAQSGTVDLQARVNFSGTQLTVANTSTDQTWMNVTCTLNPSGILQNGYDFKVNRLKPGEKFTVGAMQFAKSDGTRFNPFQTKPLKMHISAQVDGRFAFYAGGWN